MKTTAWRGIPKIRGTVTTTREKKDNEINDLGQNGQNWGYPYYYTEQNQCTLTTTRDFVGYRYYYTRENRSTVATTQNKIWYIIVPLLLHMFIFGYYN